MLPERHLKSVLMLLIVKSVSGYILRSNIYQLEPDHEDYSGEENNPFVVIVIKDDYTDDDYDKVYRSKERKGMSIEYTLHNTTNVTKKTDENKSLEPSKEVSSEKEPNRDFDGLKLTRQQKTMLRKKWRASCDKKAAKTCKKACVAAAKKVCRAYHCKRSMKKQFKKECKISCKYKFLGIKSSVVSESD